MDEGLPIAYPVLESGVPVYSSDGVEVGQVDHVVAAPEKDIFHGLVMRAGGATKFVAADEVASLHERGVDLRLEAAAIDGLPSPHGAAPAQHLREPGIKPSSWKHLVDRLTGADPNRRDWSAD